MCLQDFYHYRKATVCSDDPLTAMETPQKMWYRDLYAAGAYFAQSSVSLLKIVSVLWLLLVNGLLSSAPKSSLSGRAKAEMPVYYPSKRGATPLRSSEASGVTALHSQSRLNAPLGPQLHLRNPTATILKSLHRTSQIGRKF